MGDNWLFDPAHGAQRVSPCLHAEVRYSMRAWFPAVADETAGASSQRTALLFSHLIPLPLAVPEIMVGATGFEPVTSCV